MEFCQAWRMSHTIRKLIAILLAIWIPLFSGNALASSISMHSDEAGRVEKHDTAHAAAQPHPAVAMDHCTMQSESANNHAHPDCKHSAACQLACSGFVATGWQGVFFSVSPEHAITPYLTSFQTRSVAPLDTPPLARV
jgi:hypothetical protein